MKMAEGLKKKEQIQPPAQVQEEQKVEEEAKVEEPPNLDEMSLPSDTSENLADTGVNLLGIDREIVPTTSMHIINKVAEGGQWKLVQSDS